MVVNGCGSGHSTASYELPQQCAAAVFRGMATGLHDIPNREICAIQDARTHKGAVDHNLNCLYRCRNRWYLLPHCAAND